MSESLIGFSILQTKLRKPVLTGDLLDRPRLLQLLQKGMERPLTLIAAPAGYGKSTLVSLWLEHHRPPYFWYSLEKSDNDLRVFLNYFIHGLQQLYPENGKNVRKLIHPIQLPTFPLLVNHLSNALDQIPYPYVIVLDDYHLIDNRDIHKLFAEILKHPPRHMHLILLVRRDPPLPLNWLRSKDLMVDVRTAQLRFSREEIAQFLEKSIQQKISEKTLTSLEEKTEGWVTGLRLISIFLKQKQNMDALLEKLPTNTYYVMEYFLTEVLNILELPIYDFLLKTSLLNRISAPLSEVLIEAKNSGVGQRYLNWLVEQNLFIEPLDDRNEWFRYHHLFQQFLRQQLNRKLTREQIAQLHLRASDWLDAHGYVEDALYHAFQAGQIPRVVELMEKHRDSLLNQDKWWILEKWIQKLPEEVIRHNVKLLIARMWTEYFKEFTPRVEQLLRLVEHESTSQQLERSNQGEIEFFKGYYLFWHQPSRAMVTLFRNAFQWIRDDFPLARGAAVVYYVLALQMTGRQQEAEQLMHQLLYYQDISAILKSRSLAGIIFVYFVSGDLSRVTEHLEELKSLVDRGHTDYVAAWYAYLKGYVHYQRNQLTQAVEHFRTAVEYRHLLGFRVTIDSMAGLAYAYHVLQEEEQLEEVLALLDDYARFTRNPFIINIAHSTRTRVSLISGDYSGASRYLKSIDLSNDRPTMVFWLEAPSVSALHARVVLAPPSEREQVLQEVNHLLTCARNTHNVAKTLELLLIQALLLKKLNRHNEAVQAVQEAVELGCPGEWIQPFVLIGAEIAPLLQKISFHPENLNYLNRILSALNAQKFHQPVGRELVALPTTSTNHIGELSNRELDVLELLARRLSNKEIAQRLSISPATVKRHTVNIYHKLGVNNRRLAVQKARALKLIPETSDSPS